MYNEHVLFEARDKPVSIPKLQAAFKWKPFYYHDNIILLPTDSRIEKSADN